VTTRGERGRVGPPRRSPRLGRHSAPIDPIGARTLSSRRSGRGRYRPPADPSVEGDVRAILAKASSLLSRPTPPFGGCQVRLAVASPSRDIARGRIHGLALACLPRRQRTPAALDAPQPVLICGGSLATRSDVSVMNRTQEPDVRILLDPPEHRALTTEQIVESGFPSHSGWTRLHGDPS
jgi:hypothetical protein